MTTTSLQTPAVDNSADDNEDFDASTASARPVLWVVLLLTGLFALAGFVALGMWQVNRLNWKTELIERVDQRVKAAPVPAPGPAEWAGLNESSAEYRRVTLRGRYAHEQETLVQAMTALGSGYWVLTPMRTEQGFVVLVNRGFVPPDKRDPATRPVATGDALQSVEGLLRMSEPGGRVLQDNDAVANRWYSRDVAAIAAARGVGDAKSVAPYFVDVAAANDAPLDWPRPGLTVLHFSNNHLMYALTWFVLAGMVAAAIAFAAVAEIRASRRRAAAQQGA
ncbi:SURF1 family protein [Piscinibacter gummiphilus]|uniref:SURF1-like protein n=1 Tax=Piscinibacter gummiphilus TaxID=946333 RepID=A0ABZ0CS89_9BURK|nr:SURF1 family protein [Piscinibacter gummiphilus]WOB07371.1 SURF1 family protein [Piscinibacter gummiphilus]